MKVYYYSGMKKRKPKCQYVESLPVDAIEIEGFKNQFATPRGEIFARFGRLKLRRFGRNGCGYPICALRTDDGSKVFVLVHRIIAKMFVSGDNSLEVNHIDMNKENTRADNLEWITKRENHIKGHKLKPEWGKRTGERTRRALIASNPETWEEHRFVSGKEAAKFVGNPTAAGNISKACIHGREAYGFYWRKA